MDDMKKFVFVVCGASEFISTLHFSLRCIRHFSKYQVLVVTDSRRNEIPIEHDQILDIITPDSFTHHEASIYLKTGLHRFLDMTSGNLYCYLDSDVVALNYGINSIFDKFVSPIIFAADHCVFNQFSPYAIDCNCLAKFKRIADEYSLVESFINSNQFLACSSFVKEKEYILDYFIRLKTFKNFYKAIAYYLQRYILPFRRVSIGEYYLIKKTHMWYNRQHQCVYYDYDYFEKKFRLETGIYFDSETNCWRNRNKEDLTPRVPFCNHLSEYLKIKYSVEIPADWQHWNGGVFLFNNSSIEFMERWHRQTLDEFENPETKTRDQGTLALTVWQMNLQNQKLLDREFNFIAEFDNENIGYTPDKGFTFDGFNSIFSPCFIHIYHEWGKCEWSIWRQVKQIHDMQPKHRTI